MSTSKPTRTYAFRPLADTEGKNIPRKGMFALKPAKFSDTSSDSSADNISSRPDSPALERENRFEREMSRSVRMSSAPPEFNSVVLEMTPISGIIPRLSDSDPDRASEPRNSNEESERVYTPISMFGELSNIFNDSRKTSNASYHSDNESSAIYHESFEVPDEALTEEQSHVLRQAMNNLSDEQYATFVKRVQLADQQRENARSPSLIPAHLKGKVADWSDRVIPGVPQSELNLESQRAQLDEFHKAKIESEDNSWMQKDSEELKASFRSDSGLIASTPQKEATIHVNDEGVIVGSLLDELNQYKAQRMKAREERRLARQQERAEHKQRKQIEREERSRQEEYQKQRLELEKQRQKLEKERKKSEKLESKRKTEEARVLKKLEANRI